MPETTLPVRRRVNVIGVLMSLVFLTVASVGLTGDPWWLVDSAAKWIVAGVIALVGLGLLVSSLPGAKQSPNRSGQR